MYLSIYATIFCCVFQPFCCIFSYFIILPKLLFLLALFLSLLFFLHIICIYYTCDSIVICLYPSPTAASSSFLSALHTILSCIFLTPPFLRWHFGFVDQCQISTHMWHDTYAVICASTIMHIHIYFYLATSHLNMYANVRISFHCCHFISATVSCQHPYAQLPMYIHTLCIYEEYTCYWFRMRLSPLSLPL